MEHSSDHQKMLVGAMCCVLFICGSTSTVLSCQMISARGWLVNAACTGVTGINITGVTEYECTLYCMQHSTCMAVNYDIQSNVCVGMEKPCPVVQPLSHVYYRILAASGSHWCAHWMANMDWNNPRIIKVNGELETYYPVGVTRFQTGDGDIVPAKWPNNNYYSFSVKLGTDLVVSEFEMLVVDDSCSMRWVYYDASTGDPLPTGAIQGGYLADRTPLYVAVIHARENRRVPGYYNHATRMGTCEYFGETTVQQVDLLIAV